MKMVVSSDVEGEDNETRVIDTSVNGDSGEGDGRADSDDG